MGYLAASGTDIGNYGERKIKAVTNSGIPISLCAQVTDVRAPLGSVSHMLKTGNKVVFEEGNSRILHKKTGHVIPMREKNGSFEVDLWLPRAPRPAVTEVHNKYKGLEEEDEEEKEEEGEKNDDEPVISMDFIRRG